MQLVPRFYDTSSGQVLIGRCDVKDWPEQKLLEKISVVFQDVHLFHDTILGNLRIANTDASEAEIIAACKAAYIHDFIESLPEGYQTIIGEKGSKLSGGERQRLSIARALLKNAPILLLDEVTPNVDAENEILIHTALKHLCQNRTVITISHHLHTVTQSDQIIVLDQGNIVGKGKHHDLLENCAAYQALWKDYNQSIQWQLALEKNHD